MSEEDLQRLLNQPGVASWRRNLAAWVESGSIQGFIIGVIILNAIILGLEATPLATTGAAPFLKFVDQLCLIIFVIEIALKAAAYRFAMLRNGWNLFDIFVVAIALVPASGPAAVLRGLRVLRIFRLLTAIPSLKRVVEAFIHSIPGLTSVIALMGIFFYVTAVMATGFFSETHPEWFGHLGLSLYTLFQVMTLESWSMGIVRPLMESHPWAWLFFVPFIVFATFTILNLFIGIIVSTMQEIGPATPTLSSATPDPSSGSAQRSGSDSATNTSSTFTSEALLARIRADLTELERRGLRTDQTSSDLATPDQATPDQAPSIATPQED